VPSVGLARSMYSHIRCTYGVLGRDVIKYTVMYGAYKRSWPTLAICKLCTLPLPRIADATYCRCSGCHVLQMPRICRCSGCHVLQMQRMPRIADATYCKCHVLQMPRIADATYCRCSGVLSFIWTHFLHCYRKSFQTTLNRIVTKTVLP
jgi:hypothetical protein